jgi:hypothetical protein
VTQQIFQALSIGHLRPYFYILALPLSEQVRPSDIVYMIAITWVSKARTSCQSVVDVRGLIVHAVGESRSFFMISFSERLAPLQFLYVCSTDR